MRASFWQVLEGAKLAKEKVVMITGAALHANGGSLMM